MIYEFKTRMISTKKNLLKYDSLKNQNIIIRASTIFQYTKKQRILFKKFETWTERNTPMTQSQTDVQSILLR